MSTLDRLRALHDALPDDGSVTLTRAALAELLAADVGDDMDCQEVARRLGRTAACVRGWCAAGRIAGSYRLNGREWRIPVASLRDFLDAQNGRSSTPSANVTTDLSAWRRELPRAG